MQAHRVKTTVQPNGKVVLDNLPFDEGETVEIIILEAKSTTNGEEKPLRGTVLKYEQPFEPVSVEDWEVLK